MSDIETIFAEIMAERAHQDEVWGGAEHDNKQTRYDFASYIGTYLDKLTDGPLEEARHRMVQIAALACAALQHCPATLPRPATDRRQRRRSDRCD